jgi:hypothetical protein
MNVARLLKRAKKSIEWGESHLEAAARDIAAAQEQGASQREIAKAVGKSVGWVNALLKWRRSGYRDQTPFGPASKEARRRARVQSPEHSRKDGANLPGNHATGAEPDADGQNDNTGTTRKEWTAAQARCGGTSKGKKPFDHGARERLIKLLGMLGSAHEGERANAALKVEQHRAELDLAWPELIVLAAVNTQAYAA